MKNLNANIDNVIMSSGNRNIQSGTQIVFTTNELVLPEDYLSCKIPDKDGYENFKVTSVEFGFRGTLQVRAVHKSRRNLHEYKIDPRSLKGMEINQITDEDTLKQLIKSESYC